MMATVGEGSAEQVVGRTAEQARLTAWLERCWRGPGGIAAVVGDAGEGKTTLVRSAVEATGAQACWGRATEGAPSPPLWIWDAVVRSAEERGLVAAGAGPSPVAPARTARTASAAVRFRRFEQYAAVVRRLAEVERPLIVLDDVQWADPESVALLSHLAAVLVDVPVPVVATMRALPPQWGVRSDLVVELDGLPRRDLAALVSQVAGFEVGPDTIDAAADVTGGNPFFAIEIAHQLVASGGVADPARWRSTLPFSVRALLIGHVHAVPAETRRVVAAAAVVGVEPDLATVVALTGAEPDDLRDHVARAVEHRLMARTGTGRLVFAHDLVREVVLDDLPAAERRDLHRRAAAILEAQSPVPAAAVAGHLLAADDPMRARRWALRAARGAADQALFGAAVEWYDRALNGVDDDRVALERAQCLARCGRWDEAQRAFASIARHARAAADDDLYARAALEVGTLGGGFEIRVLDPAQVALLEQALEVVGPDVELRARLLARLSVAGTLVVPQRRRVALAEEAVELARRLGHDAVLAVALGAWCDAHAGPRHAAERLVTSEEMLGAAVRSGDPELELLARRFRIVALLEQGELPRAWQEVDRFAVTADAIGQAGFTWYARLLEGTRAHFHGDLEAAEGLARRAAALGRTARSANAEMLARGSLLPMVRRDRGDEDWSADLRAAMAAHPEAGRGLDIATLYRAGHGADTAEVRAALADIGSAEDLDAAVPEDDGLRLQALTMVGDAAALVGDRSWMDAVRDRLEPFGDRFVLDGSASVCYGPAHATLGRMARARGDQETAAAHLERAAELLRRADGLLLLAEVEAERAALATDPPVAPPSAPPSTALAPDLGSLVRDGDSWSVSFGTEHGRLRAAKGLSDLAVLLAHPGTEVHVLDLVDRAEGRTPGSGRGRRDTSGDLGPALDATARAAYEARIRELTERIDEAQEVGDDLAASALDEERALLLEQLAGALGLSGRPRPQGSDAERARKAVAMRIRDTIGRIDEIAPTLGRHLRTSVRTGTFCAYEPERSVRWDVAP